MVNRILSEQITNSKSSILLLGPRQTGKTTLLKQMKPDLIINFASEREYQDHLSNPGLIEDLVEKHKPKLVLVDEVQRIPSIMNSIQVLIDDKKIRFLVTGSSARKLKRGQVNLLPGRVINKQLFPLTVAELGFNIETSDAISWGFLPGIVHDKSKQNKEELLSSYVSNYLREEIQQESLTRNLQGYSRFLNALPEWTSKVLDYSKIAAKNKLNRFAVHRFFEIYEDTLLGQRIYCSQDFDQELTVKHPKFYFFDNGVLNGILRQYQPSGDMLGACCETIVYNQLRAILTYKGKPFDISYFRTHTGIEVDFIVRQGAQITAIEVKYTDRLADNDVKHLKWIKNQGRKIETVLFHFGKKSFRIDGIWCLNWQEGLKQFT